MKNYFFIIVHQVHTLIKLNVRIFSFEQSFVLILVLFKIKTQFFLVTKSLRILQTIAEFAFFSFEVQALQSLTNGYRYLLPSYAIREQAICS